jgi:hypothetical protein
VAFSHGKSTTVYVNGYDLSPYLQGVDANMSAETADVSTFGLTHKAFIAGLKDATISAEGFWTGTAAQADVILRTALGGTARWTWWPAGDTLGGRGYGADTLVNAWNCMATVDDAARITAAAQASGYGAESLISLRALAAATTSWTGTAVNNGASSANGGSAYLQVTAATGTIEISIRHSSDNFAADDSELVAFTAVTGITSERKTFAGTVKQYVRGIATLAGGESITFNLGIHRD